MVERLLPERLRPRKLQSAVTRKLKEPASKSSVPLLGLKDCALLRFHLMPSDGKTTQNQPSRRVIAHPKPTRDNLANKYVQGIKHNWVTAFFGTNLFQCQSQHVEKLRE